LIVAASLAGWMSLLTFGQSAATRPAFEVATVKPSDPNAGRGIGNRYTADRFSWTNVPLKRLVGACYRFEDYQISGGPDWINTAKWDVAGKTETPLSGPDRYPTMFRMCQTLLEDRFQLKVYRETRELPVYYLVVGKNGHKLHEYHEGERDAPKGLRVQNGELSGMAEMSNLAFFLSLQMDRPVHDKTGLTGRFVFSLKYAPDDRRAEPGEEALATDTNRPSLFTAIQEQLGLKLEGQKGPVEILVIDSVQKPSEN